MPKGMLFWVVYLIALILTIWLGWPWGLGGIPILILFVLIGLLGWGVFGKPVQ